MLMVDLKKLQSDRRDTREQARSTLVFDVQDAARKVDVASEEIEGERNILPKFVDDLMADFEAELRRAYLLGKADLLAELTGEPRAQVKEKLAYRD